MRETQPFGILLLFTCAVFDVFLLLIGKYVIFPLLSDAPYLPKEHAQTYTHFATFEGYSGRESSEAINTIAFSSNGQTLAAAGSKKVFLWDIDRSDLMSILKVPSGRIREVTFSPDGRTLAIVSTDTAPSSPHPTILWDPSAQIQKKAHYHHTPHTIRLWDPKTGISRLTFTVGISPITKLEFSPDSTKLLIASQNGVIDVYDNTTGHRDLVSFGLFAHDRILNKIGTIAFAASLGDKIIATWIWKTGGFMPSRIPKTETDPRFSMVQWFTNFRFVGEPSIGLNTGADGPLLFLTPNTYRVGALAFSPDGKILASSGRGREIRLYDVANAKIQLWDAATGHLIHTFNSPGGHVNLLAFSPDGKTLASVDSHFGSPCPNKIFIWDIENYRLLSIITAGKATIKALKFAPDSITLASAHSNGTVHLWDITGQHR